MEGLVKCRVCGWIWETAPPGMGYTRCRCGTPGTTDAMEPTDGACLPVGATINGIVISGEPSPQRGQRNV